jgi:hypothetical protein
MDDPNLHQNVISHENFIPFQAACQQAVTAVMFDVQVTSDVFVANTGLKSI